MYVQQMSKRALQNGQENDSHSVSLFWAYIVRPLSTLHTTIVLLLLIIQFCIHECGWLPMHIVEESLDRQEISKWNKAPNIFSPVGKASFGLSWMHRTRMKWAIVFSGVGSRIFAIGDVMCSTYVYLSLSWFRYWRPHARVRKSAIRKKKEKKKK